MNRSRAPARTYQSHRENQRERILEAAQRLLVREGIDRVSMSDIAREAHLTRATLYEYFPSKPEIAWAIFQKLLEDGRGQIERQFREGQGSGFERVQTMMLTMAGFLDAYPERLRFVVEFNTLYAREGDPYRVRQIVERGWPGGYDSFARLIRQGIADGSIRPELDPDLLSASILNLINAVNSRFALLGDLIRVEYGQPVKEIYQEICRAFLRGIQSTPTLQENNQ